VMWINIKENWKCLLC